MKKILYKFADGTESVVTVSDELYAIHEELEKAEKQSNKRETRRHISLNYLNENGIDFELEDSNPLTSLIRNENESEIWDCLTKNLKLKQIELVEMFFYKGKTVTQIAKELNCSHATISKRLKVILEKLKNFF